jgi:hypothetical protein
VNEALESFDSDRHFQVWAYTVSHGQLLLRSTKSDQEATRVEVLFKGVTRFDLPMSLDGFHVRRNGREYTAHGDGWSGSIVALAMFTVEDDGHYADPSSLYIGGIQ